MIRQVAFPDKPGCPLGTVMFEQGEEGRYNFLPEQLHNKSYFHYYFRDALGTLMLLSCQLETGRFIGRHTWKASTYSRNCVELDQVLDTPEPLDFYPKGAVTSRFRPVWKYDGTSRDVTRAKWISIVGDTEGFLRKITLELL